MTIDDIRECLRADAEAHRFTDAMKSAQVPIGTARKIMRGDTLHGRTDTVLKLFAYYAPRLKSARK